MIGSLRHLASMAGRALALLAVMLVALTPALPAHAHAGWERAPAVRAHSDGATHHANDGTAALSHDRSDPDRDAPSPVSQHAADCCFVCHAPVLPHVAAVPLPRAAIRDALRPADRVAPPDALAERQPEPPRPSA